MKYEVKNQEILLVDKSYNIVFTMGKDFDISKGLPAKLHNRLKSMNLTVRRAYRNAKDDTIRCIGYQPKHENRYYYHLFVKEKSRHKVKYDDLFDALIQLKDDMIAMDVTKIAMPKLCIGDDGLAWSKVEELIHTVFEDTDIEILVCASILDRDNPLPEEKIEIKEPETFIPAETEEEE